MSWCNPPVGGGGRGELIINFNLFGCPDEYVKPEAKGRSKTCRILPLVDIQPTRCVHGKNIKSSSWAVVFMCARCLNRICFSDDFAELWASNLTVRPIISSGRTTLHTAKNQSLILLHYVPSLAGGIISRDRNMTNSYEIQVKRETNGLYYYLYTQHPCAGVQEGTKRHNCQNHHHHYQ